MENFTIKGNHPVMEKILNISQRVATTDSTVLIMGESGTGKELIARFIHAHSQRANQPFIAVNCGAIPPDLLESEMFGHERGAFTGAVGRAHGHVPAGQRRHDLPRRDRRDDGRPAGQAAARPAGEGDSAGRRRTAPVKVDVRVIAASNRDLASEVEKGRFREDLFYRLQVIPILLPPLRERRSDIPLLVQHFLDKYNAKHEGRACQVADDAMVHLWEYDWPGNVRELENLVERMVVLSDDGFIRVDSLPPNIRSFISEKKIPRPTLTEEGIDLNRAVEEFEYRLIDEALRRTKGNKQAAARLLGLKRTTLVAKLRRKTGGAGEAEGYLI